MRRCRADRPFGPLFPDFESCDNEFTGENRDLGFIVTYRDKLLLCPNGQGECFGEFRSCGRNAHFLLNFSNNTLLPSCSPTLVEDNVSDVPGIQSFGTSWME
jgi:hypothetical protein